MINSKSDYQIIWPPVALPGSLVIVCEATQREQIVRLEAANSPMVYSVHAILSDHIPLAGEISEIVTRKTTHRIKLSENLLPIYLHHGGISVVYFELCADHDNILSHIKVDVETHAPLAAFQLARTAVNELLDTMMRRAWLPLVVTRLELFSYSDPSPLAFEILLPLPFNIHIGPLGGIHQYPVFSELESLVREAVCATSPYYRFLCAYRLYEGIEKLRHWLKVAAAKFAVQAPLPKALPVDHSLLQGMGFRPEMLSGVRNVADLHAQLKTVRNQVAHFLLDRKTKAPPLHLSEGHAYSHFSMLGAAMLHYSHLSLNELSTFFQQHLQFALTQGSILPLWEEHSRFRIVDTTDMQNEPQPGDTQDAP